MRDSLWYAAYGSNLSAARFAHYLQGGQPLGASRDYPGARDRTPPSGDRPLALPGEVFFGWSSPTWGGGVAFWDESARGTALARGYRITYEQLSDVVAQEMHRDPGVDLDLSGLADGERIVLGDGRYETLVHAGDVDGEPVVTFTCPAGERRPEVNVPTAAYLMMLAGAWLSPTD